MATSTITSKGQTTIPADIRAFLKVGAGDKLLFIPQPDGKVLLTSKTLDVRELYGCLPKPKKKYSMEETRRAIGEYLAKDDERIKNEYNA
jgi:AbrB family looped-hinge helix DNA binding protein